MDTYNITSWNTNWNTKDAAVAKQFSNYFTISYHQSLVYKFTNIYNHIIISGYEVWTFSIHYICDRYSSRKSPSPEHSSIEWNSSSISPELQIWLILLTPSIFYFYTFLFSDHVHVFLSLWYLSWYLGYVM